MRNSAITAEYVVELLIIIILGSGKSHVAARIKYSKVRQNTGIVGREVALVCHYCPLPFAILGDVWVVLQTAAAGSVAVTSRSTLARVLGPRVGK